MGKRRASELSTKRLEILGLAPNRANSLYDANRNISTVRQDNYRLSMVESIFDQLKKTASEDIENDIPEILQYDDYESFLRSASKESVDLLFANYIRRNKPIIRFIVNLFNPHLNEMFNPLTRTSVVQIPHIVFANNFR